MDEKAQLLRMKAGDEVLPGDNAGDYFQIYEIPDDVFAGMVGKSFTVGGEIRRSALRYLRVLYIDYENRTRIGELVVNASAAEQFLAVMRELYEAGYQIHKMVLVDRYYDRIAPEVRDKGNASDSASIEDNNTSAFNYRVASNNAEVLSNHARGFAIDLNPYENPYVEADGTVLGPEEWYGDRSKATPENHMLVEGDTAVTAFKRHGFTWGGNWEGDLDYQHFECAEKTPEIHTKKEEASSGKEP